jgi:hypothetical protein
VTNVGERAFAFCSSLASVTISNKLASIQNGVFYECSSLTSVTIPENITSINSDAFEDCSSLTSITWNAKNCSDFPSIDYAPFVGINAKITSFIFGDSVEYIPAYLCCGLYYLTSVSIPNSIKSIGKSAFHGCPSLNTIYCYAVNSPTISKSTFTNYEATLYVPCEALADYQEHEIWGQFKNIQCISSEGTSVDNIITSNNKQNKVLTNGQLFILSSDKTYNVMGQEVR